mgnify:CR=1 FL=1
MADSDLMFSSVADAETAENKTIRDTAFQAASVGRGMVGAHANALGGGLFAQGLARMAGWKTPAQKKAETISNILKGTSGLDRNDPKNLRAIAQKLLQQGLPGEAEKFMQRARTIETENRTYNLDKRRVDIAQGTLTLAEEVAEDSSKQAWKNIDLTELQISNNMYRFNKTHDFNVSKQNYQEKQDNILNELANEQMTLAQAELALKENANTFTQTRAGIEDEQWRLVYDLDNYMKKAQVAQGWKRLSLDADQYKHMVFMDKAGLDLETAKFAFQKSNAEVLNAISQGSLDIEKGRLLLQKSSFEFDKHRADVTDKQWLKDHDLNKLIANANIAHTEAQTESVKLSNAYFPKAREMDEAIAEADIISKTTRVVSQPNGGSRLMVKNKEGTGWHYATDADGTILDDWNTAQSFGMDADQKRIVDAVWKEYQAVYYTGGSLTEDAQWQVPEHLLYDENTNPKGLKKVPTFQEFAKMSVENGGHGGQLNVVGALEAAYGGEGSYAAHLLATAKIDRKDNQIVMMDNNNSAFLMDFDITKISDDYRIPVDVLNKTAVFPSSENLDKDSNAQIIAEMESVRSGYEPDSAEYIAWTTQINDFITGITIPKDDNAISSASMIEGTPIRAYTTDEKLPEHLSTTKQTTDQVDEQKVKEQIVEHGTISATRTEAAIAQTGINQSEGSWKPVNRFLNSAVMSPNMKKEAKYKEVNGIWYVWSGPDTDDDGGPGRWWL